MESMPSSATEAPTMPVEAGGAVTVGARYGRGMLYMKGREPLEVFWQGPSIGWDFGGNAARVYGVAP